MTGCKEATVPLPKFLILPPIDSLRREFAERLRVDMPELDVVLVEEDADIAQEIGDADAAYGWIPPDVLPKATSLRWLQNPDAGPFFGYYYPELVAHPVTICNPRGIYSDHIAHHILMFMLALSRGLPDWMNAQRDRKWDKSARQSPYVEIANSTVLINGVGGIGAETARICSVLGAKIVGIDPRLQNLEYGEIYHTDKLDEMLPLADFVVTTVPHTPTTENMWDMSKFRKMKPSAYFINIGRGKTAVLDDLVDALQTEQIAGAGLDVFEIEPLPTDHPLWTMRNVIITPHVAVAGASNIPERRYELIRENARRFLAGEPLKNVVDKKVWY